jgi:hypothetical protein
LGIGGQERREKRELENHYFHDFLWSFSVQPPHIFSLPLNYLHAIFAFTNTNLLHQQSCILFISSHLHLEQ